LILRKDRGKIRFFFENRGVDYILISGTFIIIEVKIRFQKGCDPIVRKYSYSKHRIAKWGQMIPLFSTIGWKSRRGEKLFLMQRGVGAAASAARGGDSVRWVDWLVRADRKELSDK
jgi:hypothetical protein